MLVALVLGGSIALAGAAPPASLAAAPTPEWDQQSAANSPPARYGAAMAYDPATGEMVFFGGLGEAGSFLGETWTYDGSTWSEQHPANSPPAGSGASMAYDLATGEMVLFSGAGASGSIGETWTYNGSTWTEQFPAHSPAGRQGAAMAYDPATGEMVLFGGYGEGIGALGETWTYNGSTWTEQSPANSPPPSESPAMAYDPATGEMVLFGGVNGQSTIFNETWTYNGSAWTEQSPASSPSARYGASMAYDSETGEVVMFGGLGEAGSFLAETWIYNGSSWSEQSLTPSPPARIGAAMGYDSATGQVVLFGGLGEADPFLGDTWTYQQIKAFPSISTSASGSVAAGGKVHDEATLSGGSSPGGSIVFKLYGPDDESCTSVPAHISPTVTVSGDGNYESGEFRPPTPGVYRWVASYSGDSGNEAMVGACGEAGETVTISSDPVPPNDPTPPSVAGPSAPQQERPPAGVISAALTPPPAASVASAAIPADVEIIGAGDTIAVHGKTALVSITCRLAASCTGVVDLRSFAYNTSGGLVYSRKQYTIPAGKTTTVLMVLAKAGRKLLSHGTHASAYLYLHPSGGLPAGTPYVGGEILLVLHDRHRS